MTTQLQLFSAGPPPGPAILETQDPMVVSDRFSSEFAPHQLEVAAGVRAFSTVAHKAEMRSATVYRVSSSGDVRITTRLLPDHFLFYLPLQGRVRIQREGGGVEVVPGQIGIVNPREAYALSKLDNCTQLAIKLGRAEIESHAEALLGYPLGEPLAFETSMPVQYEACPMFVRLLDMVCDDLFAPASALAAADCGEPAESMIARLLLRELPHNHSSRLDQPDAEARTRPAPYYVRRVERLIAGDLRRRFSMDDLVAASGVSARTLYAGFRDYRGVSPMRHLRDLRLEGVRAELLAIAAGRAPRQTVTQIALDWGFNHMSDFANAYRERFGEPPSRTLQRSD